MVVEEPNLEQHKGSPCCYTKEFKFCQEDFCIECEIYKEWNVINGERAKELGFKEGK